MILESAIPACKYCAAGDAPFMCRRGSGCPDEFMHAVMYSTFSSNTQCGNSRALMLALAKERDVPLDYAGNPMWHLAAQTAGAAQLPAGACTGVASIHADACPMNVANARGQDADCTCGIVPPRRPRSQRTR